MLKKTRIVSVVMFLLICPVLGFTDPAAASDDALKLVIDSFNYWRGKASVALVDMAVHRPRWQRRITIKAWTFGEKDSLFHIV